MNVNNWRMFAACGSIRMSAWGGRRTTYPFLYFNVWAGDKFFHLLNHSFHGALDLFQEVVRPLLRSFRSPVPKDLIGSLDIYGYDLGVQEGDIWMQEVRQELLRCHQLAVDVPSQRTTRKADMTRTRKTRRISMQPPTEPRNNSPARLHST